MHPDVPLRAEEGGEEGSDCEWQATLCWPTDPFALLAMLANQPTHPPLI